MDLSQARTRGFHVLPVLIALFLNLFFGPVTPFLTSPVSALAGSSFDATDGNMTDDDNVPPMVTDWCTPAPGLRPAAIDTPSGQQDNSFKSSADPDPVPKIGAGEIPDTKVDFERVYIAGETIGTDLFAYVAFIRNDTTGTGTLSFELNQSEELVDNREKQNDPPLLITHARTQGDLLFEFGFQKSTDNWVVVLTYRTWNGNASAGSWTDPTPLLNLGDASVNAVDIVDCLDGNTPLVDGQFGEFAINLTELLGGDCRAFGSFMAKSRSSNQITSNLNDLILPIPVDFTTCATIVIEKVDQFGAPVGGAEFSITPDPFSAAHTGFLNVLDDTGAGGYTGADEDPAPGRIELNGVEPFVAPGYTICEIAAPPGDYVMDPNCITLAVGANATVTFGPFVNTFLFPVLRIEKTPDEDAANPGANDVQAGDDAVFSITLFNDGTGTADGATLNDPLPAMTNGWEVIANPGGEDAWASCLITGAAGAAQTLDCGPQDLPAGESFTVTVSAETQAPEDCGDKNNPVATGDADDAAPVTDSGNLDVLCGDLDVEKTPDEDEGDPSANDIVAGEEATFTIVTTNNGDGIAKGSELSDLSLPAVTNGWAIDSSTWALCDPIAGAPGAVQELTCGPEDIEAGGSRTVVLSTITTIEDCGPLFNPLAEVFSTNDGSDSDSGAIDVICPDVSVEKTTDTPEISAGAEARFQIVVTASGVGTSEDVTLSDNLPPVDGGWTAEIVSPDGDDTCDPIASFVLTCSFGDMEPGESKTINLSALTSPVDCGELTNQASVEALVDVDPDNNLSDEVTITVQCPDILVEKTGSGTVNATDAIFYEITVSNIGEGDAIDFVFNDTMPSIAGTWTLTSFDPPADCVLTGLALSCTIPPDDIFEAGDSFTVRLDADTEFEDCGDLTNAASASASNEPEDLLENNSDSHTITVQCPALNAIKDADGDSPEVVSAGQQIGFTISVFNSDATGTGTAYDVELNDLLPFGDGVDWEIDPAYPGPGTCEILGSPPAETLHCEFGDLAVDEFASVHVVSDTTQESCMTYLNVATITATNHPELNPDASVTVECPGLNIAKIATDDEIIAGETAEFEIVVWNTGPGDALGVTLDDDLPVPLGSDIEWLEVEDLTDSCDVVANVLHCEFGDLGITTMEESLARVTVAAETDRDDCGLLDNEAFADASNSDPVGPAMASIFVHCPLVSIEKTNDQTEPVLRGTVVGYTVTVTVSDGPADDVLVVDTLPAGLGDPTGITGGGVWDGTARTITWDLGDNVADDVYTFMYNAAVNLDVAHGVALTNVANVTSSDSQCPDVETLAEECEAESTVTVRVPTLVVDKAANVELITRTLNPQGVVISINPSTVTWTLTYTLTNGPVTNAVITEPIPTGLTFVSASNGGTFLSGVITWNLGTLTTSGFVTFVTSVNADAPTGEILNTATIDSTETEPDNGQDSIRIVEEQELGSTSIPNTAMSPPPVSNSLAVLLFGAILIASLGALAFANVRSVRQRR